MITLSVLAVICLVVVILFAVVMAVLSIPFAIIMGVLPWLLRVVAIVLCIKAALNRPLRWENFAPAAIALLLSIVLRWIF